MTDFRQRCPNTHLEKDVCTCRVKLGSDFSGLEFQGLELQPLGQREHLLPNGPDQALLAKHRVTQLTPYHQRDRSQAFLESWDAARLHSQP